eukprot:scaffold3582_cov123-Isochrysis_galbana.AAC.3
MHKVLAYTHLAPSARGCRLAVAKRYDPTPLSHNYLHTLFSKLKAPARPCVAPDGCSRPRANGMPESRGEAHAAPGHTQAAPPCVGWPCYVRRRRPGSAPPRRPRRQGLRRGSRAGATADRFPPIRHRSAPVRLRRRARARSGLGWTRAGAWWVPGKAGADGRRSPGARLESRHRQGCRAGPPSPRHRLHPVARASRCRLPR